MLLEILYPQFLTKNTLVHVTLIVSDNSEIANRITINDVFEDTDTDTLVNELITDYLLAEGVIIGEINISIFAIARIVWGDIQLDKVLDEIAEISGAYWFIDKDKKIFMRTFNITNVSVIPDIGVNYGKEITDFKPTKSGVAYRNRQILNGGFAVTDVLTQTFKGDDENQTFTLDFLIKEIVTITVDGNPVTISERSDNLETDFFYTFKNKQITQDFANIPLDPTEILEITYIGFFRIRSIQEDGAEITLRSSIIGGTGLVSYAATDESTEDINTAVLRTIALLEKYLQENVAVSFRIYENAIYDIFTIESGQTFVIDNAKLQIEGETMLITNVDFTIIMDSFSYIEIKAVDLASINSVVNQFLQINRDSTKIEIREDEIIIQTINVENIIDVEEEIEIVIGNALITGQELAVTGLQTTTLKIEGKVI